ncbi:MAG: DUF5788 family protein [Halobacteriota archaeon]
MYAERRATIIDEHVIRLEYNMTESPVKQTENSKGSLETAVWGVHFLDSHNLTKEEREKLLFKLNRIFTFVGSEIPEEIELDGQVVALHEVMWHLINHERELTPDEFSAVQKLYVALERKIQKDKSAIRSKDIDEHQALELYIEAQGLIRAAIELRDFEQGKLLDNYVKTESEERNEAQKRWLRFLKQIR